MVGRVDKIQISATDYGLAPGALSASNFVVGAAAVDAHSEFVYDASTHTLKWDANGAGGAAAITVAIFTPGVALTASDFMVV